MERSALRVVQVIRNPIRVFPLGTSPVECRRGAFKHIHFLRSVNQGSRSLWLAQSLPLKQETLMSSVCSHKPLFPRVKGKEVFPVHLPNLCRKFRLSAPVAALLDSGVVETHLEINKIRVLKSSRSRIDPSVSLRDSAKWRCHCSATSAPVEQSDLPSAGGRAASQTDNETDDLSGVQDCRNSTSAKRPTYFPYGDRFQIGENVLLPSQVIDMLGTFMDEKRREKMVQVVAGRTYGIVPVVEGLIDLGNVAAVCRSAEALGCQNVHLIERGDKKYRSSQRTTAGADKWLDFETWGSTEECFAALRERGYRIAVTHCDGGSVSTSIEDMDWSIPTAVVLGNEHAGVSPEAIAGADLQCSIPMDGFVDSFNISVAAAIIMHHAKRQRGRKGDLTPEQQQILTAEFYLRHNRKTEDLLQHLLATTTVEEKQVVGSKL